MSVAKILVSPSGKAGRDLFSYSLNTTPFVRAGLFG